MPNGKPLTANFIKHQKQPGRYYDYQTNGLHLYIRASGTKSWVQRTRLNGKTIDIGLGSVRHLALKGARAKALENSELIRAGVDPRTHRTTRIEKKTFKEVAKEALTKKKTDLSSSKHIAQWYSTIEQYAYPALGHIFVGDITKDHIVSALDKIWHTKNETAQRTRGRIEYILNFAITRGYASKPNPAAWRGNLETLLTKPSKVRVSKRMPAVQKKDIQRWWQELKRRDGTGARALQLLALLAARSGEIRGMSFEEVTYFSEAEAKERGYCGIWTIPAERMKNRTKHEIPLIQPACDLIKAQPQNGTLVFASRRNTPLSDMTLSALMKRMHKSEEGPFVDVDSNLPAVPHGLRSTFRGWAGDTKQNREVVELQLAHRIGNQVEQAYNRTQLLDQRAELLTEWHEFLENA